MGFAPADISVVANNTFPAANPAAAKIFELFTIDVLDVALQNVRYEEGANSEAASRSTPPTGSPTTATASTSGWRRR